jgi:N-acetylmuramoyl-L-alanine amidase
MAKIYLSPSSQEANLGVVPGYIEEVVCNKIADACQSILVAAGQEIKRNNPANKYNVHTDESNAWGADIHVPIHTNAAGASARGARVGCYNPDDPTKESTKLAQSVFNRLSPLTPAADHLVKYTFDEVTRTKAKCVYIEVSFHTNLEDTNWMLGTIDLIGKTIALGILDYLGIEYSEASTPSPDWQATINAKDTEIAELKSKVTFLTNEVFASQQRVVALQSAVQTAEQERDNYRNELVTLAGIIKKY